MHDHEYVGPDSRVLGYLNINVPVINMPDNTSTPFKHEKQTTQSNKQNA